MNNNESKKNFIKQPIEKHNTAAWADVDEKQPVSKVTIPSEFAVENAKDWVDSNEK
jgi:lantibiotic modifying enzyme